MALVSGQGHQPTGKGDQPMPNVILRDSQAKFNIGDLCRFNGRAPDYIVKDLRRRSRTIIDLFYDPIHQCYYFQLGGRGKSELGYWFRSYMLIAVNGNRHTIGRPRQKRKYNHHTKLLFASLNQKNGGGIVR